VPVGTNVGESVVVTNLTGWHAAAIAAMPVVPNALRERKRRLVMALSVN
jgi:hypothetical protein